MSEHQRRSPYEPEKSDGSQRNSRKDPAELREEAAAVEEPEAPEVADDGADENEAETE